MYVPYTWFFKERERPYRLSPNYKQTYNFPTIVSTSISKTIIRQKSAPANTQVNFLQSLELIKKRLII